MFSLELTKRRCEASDEPLTPTATHVFLSLKFGCGCVAFEVPVGMWVFKPTVHAYSSFSVDGFGGFQRRVLSFNVFWNCGL